MAQVGPEPVDGVATTYPPSPWLVELLSLSAESSSDFAQPETSARLVMRPVARRVLAAVR